MKSTVEIEGFEYDWLACDEDGHVALFSTAGGGYPPAAFLRDIDAHRNAIDDLLASPASTWARFAPELAPECNNTWKRVAERGLFAFDSDAHGGPYQLVAAPIVPLRFDDLPTLVSEVASRLRLPMRFATTAIITTELLSGL